MESQLEQLSKKETIELREKHVGKSCQLFFREDPLKIVRGEGQYMYDENGTKFLDCINNVAHVGHCHPKVVSAGSRQMALLSTNNRFLHDELVILAKRISDLLPDQLDVCFLVNSGSEANDLALRLARAHTGNRDVITLEHAYHGHLTSMIDISPYKFNLPGAPPKPDHVHVAPFPDTYRGLYRTEDYPDRSSEDFGRMYGDLVGDICDKVKTKYNSGESTNNANNCSNSQVISNGQIPKKGSGVCAFIAESLISCGGQIVLPPGYLETAYRHVRATGGVCIADEVQVGFGRTGRWWAFEHQGPDVRPDIVTMGKPMGNGHPVAAVVTTREIAKSFQDTGVEYFNTYGGNPVSCAIANAVLDVLGETDVLAHAHQIGAQLMRGGAELMLRHPLVGDVRGKGLFVGFELVEDRITKLPATKKAKWIVNRIRERHHMLLSTDGPDGNVIKVKPPMVFNEQNAKDLLEALDQTLTELETLENEEKRVSNTTPSTTVTSATTNLSCHVNNVPTKAKRDLIKSI